MDLDRNGIIGTAIFHALIAFLLIFFGFSYPDPPPEEEGVLVNFGTDDLGSGYIEPAGDETQGGQAETQPSEEVVTESQPEPTPPAETQAPVPEETQTYEESPVKESKPDPEEIRRRELEKQRQEELRKQQEEQERKRKQAEKLQRMGETAFGNKGVGTEEGSEGETQGTGNQGSVNGQPNVDNYGEGGGLGSGISYGLGNRKSRGDLPVPSVDACEVTSRIIVKVQIDVDGDGNVVGTPRVIESTYQDDCIYSAVIKAARQSKFTASDEYRQRGWIRYIIEP